MKKYCFSIVSFDPDIFMCSNVRIFPQPLVSHSSVVLAFCDAYCNQSGPINRVLLSQAMAIIMPFTALTLCLNVCL